MEVSSSSQPSEPSKLSGATLFALIIGIDKYISSAIKNLSGAVADATAFKEYLEKDLDVPQARIDFLANEDATRKNIIERLEKLAKKNNGIEKNDPIFIFYAGHGAQAIPPTADARRMELLISHDFTNNDRMPNSPESDLSQLQEGVRGGFLNSSAVLKPQAKMIPGIPDLELAVWINKIAAEKGDNITIVLDCCHSASLTRGGSGDIRSRSIDFAADYNLHNDVCSSLNRDEVKNLMFATRGSQSLTGFTHVGARSHVLLAACKSTELALESDGRGHFSTQFLALLKDKRPDKLRYCDVIGNLTLKDGQHPQCLGEHRGRFIFDGKVVPRPLKKFFQVVPFKDKDGKVTEKYTIAAGGNEGILSKGTKFAICDDNNRASELAILVAEEVKISSCILTFPPGDPYSLLPLSAVAIQIGAPIKLYIHPPTEYIYSVVRDFAIDIVVVRVEGEADVSMQLDGNDIITFRVLRQIRAAVDSHYTLPHQKINRDAKDIVRVLKDMSFFFWQLNRTSQNKALLEDIIVHFYELEENDGVFTTVGKNLYANSIVDFVPKEQAAYGLEIKNKSKVDDLYPCMYYFDITEFSILKYYDLDLTDRDSHDIESPLPKGGTLEVGYGSGGAAPFEYYIPDGQDMDVGILKIFLFSKPVDLGDLSQASPFEGSRASRIRPKPPKTSLSWGVIDIPIIQRRLPN